MSILNSRNRIYVFALMAALAAGAAGVCGFAQEAKEVPSAPQSAKPSNAQEGLSAQPGQVKKEEAEEDNVYRHTKLVQAISDAVFHDDKSATEPEKVELRDKHIEQTARAFEWINAAIILLCIIIPLAKFLPKVMRKRSQTLSHNLELARKTTADANTRLSAVEAQLAKLDEEIGKIRAQVEDESKNDEARIKASIEEESARIVAHAEQEIASASAHAQRELRNFAADLAIEQASRQLTLTPEADKALISEFVREATNGAAKGGQN